MTPEKIKKAVDEAHRFLERADAAAQAFEAMSGLSGRTYMVNNDTKATAALRRSSMDLSRALADLRKRG